MENTATKAAQTSVSIPDVQDFLKAGVQFGHQAKKWNPKMSEYIFAKRGQIHIIDLSKTMAKLQEALAFLEKAAAEGQILIVASKRQASEIAKEVAMKSGAYYVVHRWPGGLFTNFDLIKQSLSKYRKLEEEFETGVENRTKFEIAMMKKEWQKMNRLYEGVKTMDGYPKAIVIVDSKYERGVVKEAKRVGVPIVALVDTNADPTLVDYAIPANDDAIKSVQLLLDLMGEAIKKGNKGKGVVHNNKDYSKYEVKIIRKEEEVEAVADVVTGPEVQKEEPKVVKVSSQKPKGEKGMLEKMQQESESKRVKKAAKSR